MGQLLGLGWCRKIPVIMNGTHRTIRQASHWQLRLRRSDRPQRLGEEQSRSRPGGLRLPQPQQDDQKTELAGGAAC